MRANLKVIHVLPIAYINVSEQLREQLELKIEDLFKQNRFSQYSNLRVKNYENVSKADFLCAYLIGRATCNYMLSGKLLQGIKIWFNMYYDDRLSVIDKFRGCYQQVRPDIKYSENSGTSILFCKFLINELLTILADSRWQVLINNGD